MPPKSEEQTFSFEVVATLVAAIMETGGTVGTKEYKLMASLEPSRTESSFEHQFRKVKKRAKDLVAANGNTTIPRTPANKGGNKAENETLTTKSTGKRGRKGKHDDRDAHIDENEVVVGEPPIKKVKPEPVEDASIPNEE